MLGYPEFCMKKCRACSRISKYVHEAVLIHTLCTCCPMKALKNSFDFRMQAKNLLNSITSIFTLPSLLLLRSYVYIDYEKLIMNDAWRSRKVEEATIRFANCLSFVWRGSLSLSLSLSPLTQRGTQLIAQIPGQTGGGQKKILHDLNAGIAGIMWALCHLPTAEKSLLSMEVWEDLYLSFTCRLGSLGFTQFQSRIWNF